jgi:hypothetical protein
MSEKNYVIKGSITPEVDEVEIERDGDMFTIYLIDETGGSLEIFLHRNEVDKLMSELYKHSAYHKSYGGE